MYVDALLPLGRGLLQDSEMPMIAIRDTFRRARPHFVGLGLAMTMACADDPTPYECGFEEGSPCFEDEDCDGVLRCDQSRGRCLYPCTRDHECNWSHFCEYEVGFCAPLRCE